MAQINIQNACLLCSNSILILMFLLCLFIFFVLALNNPTLLILNLKSVFYISLSLSKGKIQGARQGSA